MNILQKKLQSIGKQGSLVLTRFKFSRYSYKCFYIFFVKIISILCSGHKNGLIDFKPLFFIAILLFCSLRGIFWQINDGWKLSGSRDMALFKVKNMTTKIVQKYKGGFYKVSPLKINPSIRSEIIFREYLRD